MKVSNFVPYVLAIISTQIWTAKNDWIVFSFDWTIDFTITFAPKRSSNNPTLNMDETDDSELKLLRSEAQDLREKLQAARSEVRDTTLKEASGSVTSIGMVLLHKRKTLRGHFGKIVGLHWGPEPHGRFVCASQSCQLIVWKPVTSALDKVFKLETSFVMCCAYAPSGDLVACAGLDNRCSIYNLAKEPKYNSAPVLQLMGHQGFISFVRFLDDTRVLTASGDETCALWDVQASAHVPRSRFRGHVGAVTCLALNPKDPNMFVSGACDFTAKIWDIRTSSCAQTFTGHQSDINAIQYFPSGQCFVTGSDDGTCRLFDIRSDQELHAYGTLIDSQDAKREGYAVTALDLSCSGRLLIAGRDNGQCVIWDMLTGEGKFKIQAHDGRLSSLGVSPDGKALATGSWDCTLKIWN